MFTVIVYFYSTDGSIQCFTLSFSDEGSANARAKEEAKPIGTYSAEVHGPNGSFIRSFEGASYR